MVKVHPMLSKKKCFEMSQINQGYDWKRYTPPNKWIDQLAYLICQNMLEDTRFLKKSAMQIRAQLERHCSFNSDLKMLLARIYAVFSGLVQDPHIYFESAKHGTMLAEKLVEGLDHCSPGYYNRVSMLWQCWFIEKNIAERLGKIRVDLVQRVAMAVSDEVHAQNAVFVLAQTLKLGVQPPNGNDKFSPYMFRSNIVTNMLQNAFREGYTPVLIVKRIEEQLMARLYTDGYIGLKADGKGYGGECYQAWIDLFKTVFSLSAIDYEEWLVTDAESIVKDINLARMRQAIIETLFKEGFYINHSGSPTPTLASVQLDLTNHHELIYWIQYLGNQNELERQLVLLDQTNFSDVLMNPVCQQSDIVSWFSNATLPTNPLAIKQLEFLSRLLSFVKDMKNETGGQAHWAYSSIKSFIYAWIARNALSEEMQKAVLIFGVRHDLWDLVESRLNEKSLSVLSNKDTLLTLAIREKNANMAMQLIKAGCNIQGMDSDVEPICLAITQHLDDVVEHLLVCGVAPTAKAFILAAKKGSVWALQGLLARQPRLLNKTDDDMTAISWAAMNGHYEAVQYLLEQTETTNRGITPEESPLELALKSGHDKVAALLVSHGFECKAYLKEQRVEHLIYLVITKDYINTLIVLLNRNPSLLKRKDSMGRSPLQYAVTNESRKVIDCFLQRGASCEEALQMAILSKNDLIAKHIVDVRTRSMTPLNKEALLVFLTPFISDMITMGLLETVKCLVKLFPTLVQDNQLAPLRLAAANGHLDMVRYFFNKINVSTGVNKAMAVEALDRAIKNGHESVVDFLLREQVRPIVYRPVSWWSAPNINLKIAKKMDVVHYSDTRSREPEYKKSVRFFGWTFNFGYSKQAKIAAANALTSVLIGQEDKSILDAHEGALNNGALGRIYRSVLGQPFS